MVMLDLLYLISGKQILEIREIKNNDFTSANTIYKGYCGTISNDFIEQIENYAVKGIVVVKDTLWVYIQRNKVKPIKKIKNPETSTVIPTIHKLLSLKINPTIICCLVIVLIGLIIAGLLFR